eukprot:XP_015573654.1 plant cysteine oxidase 2 isoform X1 [Ricinus communis]
MGIETSVAKRKGKEFGEVEKEKNPILNNTNTRGGKKAARGRHIKKTAVVSPVQKLYDTCKDVFSIGGPGVVPAPDKIEKLRAVLDVITPEDVGLHPEMPYFRLPVAGRAPPIRYLHIHECNKFSIGIFCFPPSGVIPLHNHPGMTVFSKLLFGKMHIKSYDWVDEDSVNGSAVVNPSEVAFVNAVKQPNVQQPEVNQPEVQQPEEKQPEITQLEEKQPEVPQLEEKQPEIQSPEEKQLEIQQSEEKQPEVKQTEFQPPQGKQHDVQRPSVRLAKVKIDSDFTAPCNPCILYPVDGGNMHCFTAATACAVLDVLGPPYSDPEGRHCTYYNDFPFANFSVDGVSLPEEEREGYAWLQERTKQPDDFKMVGELYRGPKIVKK